ncbi:MAG: helix-hairpin-helix domain-containing protein [Ignavibacteriales bacterium]|nr:helix-hairpin-helix domain-containing protein [Ignavibacteriales bacterium]MCB9260046.1 helix-hairpin-helix domain-containing protein [Ignavibacteriales bacterium]
MKITVKIITYLLSISSILFSQIDTTEIIDQNIFELKENLFEDNVDRSNYDLINSLLSNPIEINSSTLENLTELPFLTLQDAQTIIKERNRKKYFRSYGDFRTIKGIHPDILLMLKPFIKFDESKKDNSLSVNFHSRAISDLQNEQGYLNGNYLGSKLKSYNRIGVGYGEIKGRFLIEKDAGEKPYTDLTTGFIEYKSDGIIDKIILGDFDFEFGQGLAVWSPYGYSKGNDAVNASGKRGRGIRPHTSSEENNFFRGLAVQSTLNNFSFTAFASSDKKDAAIDEFDNVTSLIYTGFHRTENEKSKFDALNSKTFGGSVKYSLENFLNIGLLHYSNTFNKNLQFGDNSLNGKNFNFTSLSYNLYYNKLNLLGEISNNGKSFASITSLYLGLNESVQFVTSYRNYPNNYFNIYSSGFGESSNTQNETGYYFGLRITTDYGKFNIYYDIYKFNYFNFYSDMFSSNGNDFLFNYENKIFKGVNLKLKIKDEIKEKMIALDSKDEIGENEKLNVRTTLDYKLTKNIYGKSRIEYVKYSVHKTNEEGYLLLQDIKLLFTKQLNLTSRIVFFQTKSFNSRVYEFENDIRGVMTNLALFGEGLRWYLLLHYKFSNNLYTYLKYSETFKPNEKSLGSGNSEIFGNLDNRISFQIDYRL